MKSSRVYHIKNLNFKRESADTVFMLNVPIMNIYQGEKIALLGPSGCGKSTLLDLLSLISLPDQVDQFYFSPRPGISFKMEAYRSLMHNHRRLAGLRKFHIGYVLQTGGLLPFLTVEQNIRISQELTGNHTKGWVKELSDLLNISHHLKKKPAALSTGERQRVAVARALAHKPGVIIADEPTAALDPKNADNVMSLLVSLTDQLGATLLLATHDASRLTKFCFKKISQRFDPQTASNAITSVFEYKGSEA